MVRMFFTRPDRRMPMVVKVDRPFVGQARRKHEAEGWKLKMITGPLKGQRKAGR